MLPADNHVHTEWSWDNAEGSMAEACKHAISLGLTTIAFTDHADFTRWAFPGAAKETSVVRVIDRHAASGELDPAGYWECLESCRDRFPELRILSGIEAGEPHIFQSQIASLLAAYPFERILGSLHSLPVDGELHYAPTLFKTRDPFEVMREYLQECLALVESASPFQVLAHIDYPMRAWPKPLRPFEPERFEEEYRAVLRALAMSDRALEVNTAGPWPADVVVSWWRQEGGRAVSFGSDAHEPYNVGKDFARAVAMVESHGFGKGCETHDFWRL